MVTRIRSISATAGFLQNSPVEFSPGLNCVIGARGTCKSTLVESIRFAFDSDRERVAQLLGIGPSTGASSYGLVRATLGAGSIRCEVNIDAGGELVTQVLEREVGDNTRIFIDDVREHADRGILSQVEIFSQGDLQRIAEDRNDQMRLQLIDRPHADVVSRLAAQRKTSTDRLRELGPSLRTLRVHIATLQQQLQPWASLQEQLRVVTEQAPTLSPELEKEQRDFESRTEVLRMIQRVLAIQAESARMLDGVIGAHAELPALSRTITDLGGEDTISLGSELLRLQDTLSAVAELADAVRGAEISDRAALLAKAFEDRNARYYELRQEQQAVNESLKQQQHIRRQIDHLSKLKQELDKALLEERALLDERVQVRASISTLDAEVYQLRLSEIERINEEHGDKIFLALDTGVTSTAYRMKLSALLGGSRIRFQEDVADAIAATFRPSVLVDIVESGNGQKLADALDRDLGQMNRVVSHLSDQPSFYDLEAELPSARLEITFYDEGQPKPVEVLSKGQRATALLPLILRPLPYPLIIDQPEDDLDNSFIFSSLVRTVRKLRTARQVIFITHNANLPVLGDADRVIVMQMETPSAARPPVIGSVEACKHHILDLLEGGKDAFQERERRYGSLLSGERL